MSEMSSLFENLKSTLKSFYLHKFKFAVCQNADVGRQKDYDAEAFNILLVVTGARDALLMQAFEDQSDAGEGGDEIHAVMKARFLKVKNILDSVKNVTVRMDSHYDVWIHHNRIQHEVEGKWNSAKLTDILRYGCKMPLKFNNACSAVFHFNKQYFMGIVFELQDFSKMSLFCLQTLESFEPLASHLNGRVTVQFKKPKAR